MTKWTGPGRRTVRGDGATDHPDLSLYLQKARQVAGEVVNQIKLGNIWSGTRTYRIADDAVVRINVLNNITGFEPVVNMELLLDRGRRDGEDEEQSVPILAAFGLYDVPRTGISIISEEHVFTAYSDAQGNLVFGEATDTEAGRLDWSRGVRKSGRTLALASERSDVLSWEAGHVSRLATTACTGTYVYRNGKRWARFLWTVNGAALRTIGGRDYLYIVAVSSSQQYEVYRTLAQDEFALDYGSEDFPEWELVSQLTPPGITHTRAPVFFSRSGTHLVGVLGSPHFPAHGVPGEQHIVYGAVEEPTYEKIEVATFPEFFEEDDHSVTFRRNVNFAFGGRVRYLAADFYGNDTEPTFLKFEDLHNVDEQVMPPPGSSSGNAEFILHLTHYNFDTGGPTDTVVTKYEPMGLTASASRGGALNFPQRELGRLRVERAGEVLFDTPCGSLECSGQFSYSAAHTFFLETEPGTISDTEVDFYVDSGWIESATVGLDSSCTFNGIAQLLLFDLRVAQLVTTNIENGHMSVSSSGTAGSQATTPGSTISVSYQESLRIYRDWELVSETRFRNGGMLANDVTVVSSVSSNRSTEFVYSRSFSGSFSTISENHTIDSLSATHLEGYLKSVLDIAFSPAGSAGNFSIFKHSPFTVFAQPWLYAVGYNVNYSGGQVVGLHQLDDQAARDAWNQQFPNVQLTTVSSSGQEQPSAASIGSEFFGVVRFPDNLGRDAPPLFLLNTTEMEEIEGVNEVRVETILSGSELVGI